MPLKKSTKKPKNETLQLHCKCNQCKNWELVFKNPSSYGDYFLVCSSCGEEVEIRIVGIDPHLAIHWEKA